MRGCALVKSERLHADDGLVSNRMSLSAPVPVYLHDLTLLNDRFVIEFVEDFVVTLCEAPNFLPFMFERHFGCAV